MKSSNVTAANGSPVQFSGHSGHLPYDMQEVEPRLAEYEMQFKYKALDLLHTIPGEPRTISILDFGCGRGEFLAMLAKEGYQAIGTDLDPKCVALSSQYAPCYQAAADDLERVLPGKQYDVVTAIHVLEHIEHARHAVEQLKKMTRRWMIFAVPNLATIVGLARGRVKACNPGHVQGWDAGHFQNFLENMCGLHVERWMPDTVVLPKVSRLAESLGCRRWLEYQFLPRHMPFLSASLIVLCRLPDKPGEKRS